MGLALAEFITRPQAVIQIGASELSLATLVASITSANYGWCNHRVRRCVAPLLPGDPEKPLHNMSTPSRLPRNTQRLSFYFQHPTDTTKF
jgi:hypothetical protein